MANTRVFYITSVLASNTSQAWPDAIAHANALLSLDPGRVMLAWEDGALPIPADKGQTAWAALKAIAAGRALRIDAAEHLAKLGFKLSIAPEDNPECGAEPVCSITAMPPGPRKPPRTLIVQEWAAAVNREAPAEIARRAHEATHALCRGQ